MHNQPITKQALRAVIKATEDLNLSTYPKLIGPLNRYLVEPSLAFNEEDSDLPTMADHTWMHDNKLTLDLDVMRTYSQIRYSNHATKEGITALTASINNTLNLIQAEIIPEIEEVTKEAHKLFSSILSTNAPVVPEFTVYGGSPVITSGLISNTRINELATTVANAKYTTNLHVSVSDITALLNKHTSAMLTKEDIAELNYEAITKLVTDPMSLPELIKANPKLRNANVMLTTLLMAIVSTELLLSTDLTFNLTTPLSVFKDNVRTSRKLLATKAAKLLAILNSDIPKVVITNLEQGVTPVITQRVLEALTSEFEEDTINIIRGILVSGDKDLTLTNDNITSFKTYLEKYNAYSNVSNASTRLTVNRSLRKALQNYLMNKYSEFTGIDIIAKRLSNISGNDVANIEEIMTDIVCTIKYPHVPAKGFITNMLVNERLNPKATKQELLVDAYICLLGDNLLLNYGYFKDIE